MVTLDRAWCVLCALTARKPAHGHGHGHGQKRKKEFWRKLRHNGGCCCFGWAVYAPWSLNQQNVPLPAREISRVIMEVPLLLRWRLVCSLVSSWSLRLRFRRGYLLPFSIACKTKTKAKGGYPGASLPCVVVIF